MRRIAERGGCIQLAEVKSIMFALTVFGSMLVAASIVALARRQSETRKNDAPTGLGLTASSGRGHKGPSA